MRQPRSARREPQRAVEADHLAVDVSALKDMACERRELIGPSRPTMRLAGPTPAQLITMRAAPCRSRASFSAALDCSALVTSQATAWPPIFSARARAPSRLTSITVTLAPAQASSLAVAAPRPEAPPVTTAACPLMSMAKPSVYAVDLERRADAVVTLAPRSGERVASAHKRVYARLRRAMGASRVTGSASQSRSARDSAPAFAHHPPRRRAARPP